MKLVILTATDEDGVVLDSVALTLEEFKEAQAKGAAAQGIMCSLMIGN